MSTIAFQGSTARRVDVAPSPPVDNLGSGGGCSCSPSLVEKLFNWIKDAIDNVGYAIGNISITAYSNAGNNGYNYNPYVIVVTPPDMGTSNNPNYPDPSGGSSTIIVSPNEPEWTPTNSPSIMAKRLCRRIDFSDFTVRDWLLDPNNIQAVKSSYFVLLEENTLENQLFVKQAIESMKMGAEVDFSYRVITDSSFKNNPCLYGVYTQLGKASTFQSYLKKFDGSFSVANLKYSVGVNPNHPKANAVTYEPKHYLIETRFNPNNLRRPSLDIARTFIHEIIHAEIYRKLLSCAKLPNVNINNMTDSQWQTYIHNLKNNFPGLFDYYMRYLYAVPKDQQISGTQHELMAQHYRKIIIQVLKQYDNNQHSDEFYNALAWIGLMGEGDINGTTFLPPNPTVAWGKVPLSERLQIKATYDNFINSTPSCQ
ncbi:hypothetical protein [Flavobacterium sp. A45]|uniref:hypothetical protein n=1 Tax=Flavobacterium sp. A45 TaxID=1945862 RepID=UPI0009871663|nr:hypothetical protein [Flavobacterium sp. A45]OOG63825.1 hypothetical protein B0E44_17600 [Flavobacterium sp. A45]